MFDRLVGAARAAGRTLVSWWSLAKARVLTFCGLAAAEVGPVWLADRPPMTASGGPVWLGPHDLRSGDVLLSSSEAVFGWHPPDDVEEQLFRIASAAWWVRTLDGGGYSHASYFDGEMLVESTLKGVIRFPVAERVHGQRYVDVYRFVSEDGQTLEPPDWAPEPVHAAANQYVDAPYAKHDLVFGAVLALSRRANVPGHLDDMVRSMFTDALEALRSVFVKEDHVHLTCSELVYRAFDEAHPSPRYRLRVKPHDLDPGLMPGLVPGVMSTFEETRATEEEGAAESEPTADVDDASAADTHPTPEQQFAAMYLVHKHGPALETTGIPSMVGPEIDVPGSDGPNPDFVSPRDLAESPSLREIGRARPSAFPVP